MKWAVNKKMHFEVAAIRAIQILQSATLTEVLDTLTALRGGQTPPAISQPTKPAAPRVEPRPPAARTAAPPVQAAPSLAQAASPVAKPLAAPPRAEETAKVAEPPPKPAPPPVATISNEAFWQALVEAVRRDRKLISTALEAGALIHIEGPAVQIGFPQDKEFSKEFLEQGHRDFLAATASAILGRKVNVSLEMREGIVVTPVAQPPPAAKLDPMEEFKRDPLIRKALEIFRAEVQPA